MQVNWRDHIISTPDVLRGRPRIAGTRIPVSQVLGYLAAGRNFQEIKEELPDLTEQQIAACLGYARESACRLAELGGTENGLRPVRRRRPARVKA